MPRRFTVCDHPESHSIDEALVSGAPSKSVCPVQERVLCPAHRSPYDLRVGV
jgi:hypothetical protein